MTPAALLLSSALLGVSTSTLGISTSCFGLASDVTTPDRRSSRMAILEASIFTGGAVGFYTAGFSLPRFGFVATFSFELVLHISTALYLIFVIREPERELQLSATSVFGFHHVLSMGRTVFRSRERNYRAAVLLTLLSILMLSYGLAATTYMTFTFLKSPPISWDGSRYSFYHGLLLAVEGFFLVVGLPLCLRVLKLRDTATAFIGSVSRLLGLAWLSICHESWMVYTAVVFFSFAEFPTPSIRSLLSKIVGPNEKAQAFAFMSAIQSFAYLTGSQLFLGLYPTFSKMFFSGFGFALAASFQLVPVVVFAYLHFTLDLKSRPLATCAEEGSRSYESTEETAESLTVS